jgi:hypothetical protein
MSDSPSLSFPPSQTKVIIVCAVLVLVGLIVGILYFLFGRSQVPSLPLSLRLSPSLSLQPSSSYPDDDPQQQQQQQ